MRRPKPMVLAAIAGVLLLLLLGFLLLRGGNEEQDRLTGEEEVAGEAQDPEARCAAQRTYDAIKRELFRQAAQVRGSDQAAFDRIATYSAVRMERPVLRSADEALGTVGCSGLMTLDLPPGVAVVGGRRSLSAEIGYILHPAADGSGDVVMIEGADPIIVPLATLARAESNVPVAEAAPPAENVLDPNSGLPSAPEPEPAQPPEQQQAQPEPQPEPERTATANPSFNCRFARTRSEIAVCRNAELAALDRQMAAQFNRAVRNADSAERRLLERTRTRFLRFRDRCRTNECIADAYRSRMSEISDIMAGRWRGSD